MADNQKKKEFKIPDDVKEFVKLNFKKFKKHQGDYYDDKKSLKKGYYAELMDLLPPVIACVVKYGHIEAMKETKGEIYKKICDPKFVKYLKKEIERGNEFDNMILLPTLIFDINVEAKKQEALNNADKGEDEEKVTFDLSDLKELAKLILKKKIKKLVKSGIDENVAYDVLSVIPTSKILQKSQQFHIRRFYQIVYQHAKDKEIKFDKLVKVVFDGNYVPSVLTFALLERKEKIANFTETQKKLFNDITEFTFQTLEEQSKDTIFDVLKTYVEIRKRDDAQNKDTNRRYYISSLPESDYPKILKTVKRICDMNETNKKYF